jgi:hypothetical protein
MLAWVGGLAVAVAVAHPESCTTPTAGEAREAAQRAVGWIAANQDPSGRFLYRYDRDEGHVVPGYNVVRHAGTLLALEQADRAGLSGAREAADRGEAWAIDRLTRLPGDRAALTADTGASALLVAALVERGGDDHAALLADLGRFLESAVTDRGAVVARWDLDDDEPVAGSRSPFFTGEAMWALARLHATFPDEGWDVPARQISRYLTTERDDAERRFPPVSDHWGSYALDEISAWPARLTDDEVDYARRQAGLLGLQTRFESQRREEGPVRYTRGPNALGSGVGTLGEGLGALWRLAGREPQLAGRRDDLAERQRCVAGLLVARQARDDDPRVDGAWFRLGFTQVDDQQHAVSALLAALPVLEERA